MAFNEENIINTNTAENILKAIVWEPLFLNWETKNIKHRNLVWYYQILLGFDRFLKKKKNFYTTDQSETNGCILNEQKSVMQYRRVYIEVQKLPI